MTMIRLLARIALAPAGLSLAYVWWVLSLAGFTGVEHIIATVIWAAIGTAGARLAMRLSFAIANLLGAMGL